MRCNAAVSTGSFGFLVQNDGLPRPLYPIAKVEPLLTRQALCSELCPPDWQARYHNKNAGLESREAGTPREIACRFDVAFTRLRRRFSKPQVFSVAGGRFEMLSTVVMCSEVLRVAVSAVC
jgi:hypothetical protein